MLSERITPEWEWDEKMPQELWVVVLPSGDSPEAPKLEQEPQQESQQRPSAPQSRRPGSVLLHEDETWTPGRIPATARQTIMTLMRLIKNAAQRAVPAWILH